jgi:nitroreductase
MTTAPEPGEPRPERRARAAGGNVGSLTTGGEATEGGGDQPMLVGSRHLRVLTRGTRQARHPSDTDGDQVRPMTVGRIARGVVRRARNVLIRAHRVGRLSSSAYYLFFSRAFDREHRATLHGQAAYEAAGRDGANHRYLLRRRIHMLEKGLVMRPRRSTFALDYITETVKAYAAMVETQAVTSTTIDPSELLWAHDVLSMYFSVVASHPTIDAARRRFETAPAPRDIVVPPTQLQPYRREIDEPSPVAYADLLALARRRRSVRWYLPEPVPRAVIDQAMEVASLAPSACNRQPFEFRVYDDAALVQRIAAIPAGTRGFAENVPVLIVVVGKLSAFFDERDRHLIYIDGALASMSLILALETLGVSTCCLNWADVEAREREIDRTLGLAPDERVVMLISAGYPDPEGMVPSSGKKSLAFLRSFNRT